MRSHGRWFASRERYALTARGNRRSARSAFSLIELVLVMVTITLLSGIAVSRWSGATQRYQADLIARRIVSDLSMARARANYASTPVTVTFDTTANAYRITGMADFDHPGATYTVPLAASPYRARLAGVSFADGSPRVTFDGYGTPSQGGKVLVTVGSWSRTIAIDGATGSTSIQ